MSLRGATATRQSIWLPPARFAHPPWSFFSLRLPFLAFAAAILCALLAAPPARAHDPFEAFHSATVHPDRLELVVTMAQATALKLIDPTTKIPALTPENLPTHRPRLVRAAALLFILTSAKKQLSAQAATVELTDENDLIFRVTYPRPAPGKLYFSAAYLRNLGDGYGGILEVNDDANKNLGWEQLLWAHPNFDVTIPTLRTSPP
jgi:hypothetical protein